MTFAELMRIPAGRRFGQAGAMMRFAQLMRIPGVLNPGGVSFA
jgi:hypothetical protein